VFDDVRDEFETHINKLKKQDPEAESEKYKQRIVDEN